MNQKEYRVTTDGHALRPGGQEALQLPNNLSNAISRVEGQLDDKDWSPHLLQALTTLDAGRWRLSTLVRFAPTSVVPSAPTWVVCFAATAVLKHHVTPGLRQHLLAS